jgi:peptidoglycan hydrolase-like protein with peptidoglycan-binding domain
VKLIPNKLTKLSALDVLRAFRVAFAALIGGAPSNSTLAILVAQSALECARWASMHCFNFGNMRPPRDWAGSYCQFRCNEKIDGAWVWFDPPAPGSNFVAFETAEDGARYYLEQLQKRWPEAWYAAIKGNSVDFVHGLKEHGYFTADEAPYRAAVQRLCKEYFEYMSRGLFDDETGIAASAIDHGAINAIVASPVIIAPALLIGCVGPAVAAWQAIVGVSQDGSFGPLTEEATRAWQLKRGLPATGAVCAPELEAAGLSGQAEAV